MAHAVPAGKRLMTVPRHRMRLVNVTVSKCAVFALSLGAVHAADTLSQSAAPPPVLPDLPDVTGWYVRAGALGVLNQSSSTHTRNRSGRSPPGFRTGSLWRRCTLSLLQGRNASYSNVYSAGFAGGYFFNPNWSLEVASGIPMWSSVTINGNSADGPPSGTVLGNVLQITTAVTGVYHFTQFGGFQPYLGAGIAPTLTLAVRGRL